jgi:hypothetical protein
MVNQVTVVGPIVVSRAYEYGNDVVPSAPLHALQRSQLSNLAAAHGHGHCLTTLSTAHEIACVLAELPQSRLSHGLMVALVLPKMGAVPCRNLCQRRASVPLG